MHRIHPQTVKISGRDMTTLTIEDLATKLMPRQAIAGIDLGTKTIGLAMSDLSRRFATPRPVIRRVKFTMEMFGGRALKPVDNSSSTLSTYP